VTRSWGTQIDWPLYLLVYFSFVVVFIVYWGYTRGLTDLLGQPAMEFLAGKRKPKRSASQVLVSLSFLSVSSLTCSLGFLLLLLPTNHHPLRLRTPFSLDFLPFVRIFISDTRLLLGVRGLWVWGLRGPGVPETLSRAGSYRLLGGIVYIFSICFPFHGLVFFFLFSPSFLPHEAEHLIPDWIYRTSESR